MKTVDEYFGSITSSLWFYVALIVIFTLAIFASVFSSKKKKLNNRILQGQMRINDMKSYPFSVDIAKTDAIAKVNSDLQNTAANIRTDFSHFQTALKTITSKLQDAKEYLDANKFKKCEEILSENEIIIAENIALTNKMKDVLHQVLNQSSIHRQRINELKNHFHDIKTVINENPNNYTFCWEALDKITNDISHQFSDFEAIMDASRYEDATKISEQIAESINHLNYIVQTIPDYIKAGKEEIPAAKTEVTVLKQLLQEKGAYLGHLNIDGIMAQVDEELSQTLLDIKICKLDGVNEKLIECQSKINKCVTDLKQEKNAFRDICEVSNQIETLLNTTLDIIETIKKTNGTDFTRYGLKEYNDIFYKAEQIYLGNSNQYQTLTGTVKGSNISATSIIITFKQVLQEVQKNYDDVKKIQDCLSQSKISEVRVRELINKFMVVLNESKISIANSNLPNISNKYSQDFNQIDTTIKEIEKSLAEKSVDLSEILVKIDEIHNVIYVLYKNVNDIISNAKEVEDFIISCNKYRPYNNDIANALCQAEIYYRNGEYTKASNIAASAIEKIDPESAHAFLEKIKSHPEM